MAVARSRQNAAEVVNERERLRRIVSGATGMAIIETDSHGRITLFNPGAEALLGYTEEELLGQRADMFHSPDEIARQAELLGVPATLGDVALASADPELGPRDWRYIRKDGQVRTMSMTLAEMTDKNGAVVGYLSTAEDITERVRAQSALEAALQTERRAVAHLTEIDRTKDAFVSSVSHELRTPITNIVGYLELLLDGAYGDTIGRPARGARPDRRQQPPAARADRQPAHALQPGVARRPAEQAAGRPARGDPPLRPEGARRRHRARPPARRGGARATRSSCSATRSTSSGWSPTWPPTR